MAGKSIAVIGATLAAWLPDAALAQRASENVVASADDAFGTTIGNERVGLYSQSEVRGFSPVTANNIRLEGVYMDRPAAFTDRLVAANTVRVGLTAQNYLFPAPTGIVDFTIRPAGEKRLVSVLLGYGQGGAYRLEVDGQFPIIKDKLSVAAGFGTFNDELPNGGDGKVWSASIAPHWRPRPGIEIVPFYGRTTYWDRATGPLYQTAGAFLPPRVRRRNFVGPDWAEIDYTNVNFGALGKASIGSWRFAGGVFRSIYTIGKGFAHVLTDIRADGTGRRLISADPRQNTASTSGELRVSRSFREGARLHSLHVSLRARDRQASYGGGVTFDYGRTALDASAQGITEPSFRFGALSEQSIRQWTAGLGYDLRWRGLGTLSLGLQRTDYRKEVRTPTAPITRAHDPAWLYNGTLAVELARNLAVYTSYTRGLEESGVAPDSAANRTQVLPAILTSQADAGVRWRIAGDLRLVAGIFRVSKPYFANDERNVYAELGTVSQRGIEVSLAGTPVKRLAVVAGAVLTDPKLTGSPVEQGRIGRLPVGHAGRLLTLDTNYAVPGIDGLALTFNTVYHSRRVADRLNRVSVPSATILDLGFRYRFRIARTPALLRFRATNITSAYDWKVSGAGTYELNAPRGYILQLTTDL